MHNANSILVTGGTGSFGKAFIARILADYPNVERLVIYSRDELKQFEMSQMFSSDKYPQLRFFIGDVRDKERLKTALVGIDTVIHAAALKQVPVCEYNPFEAIKTNIIGAQNVIEASISQGIKRVVALSTDKAAAPINLYGATKLASDKLFVAANLYKGTQDIRFSVVRYGNVMGSRGSVIPFFMQESAKGVLPITDERMTRFNISLDEGIDLVLYALAHMWGGEIFVPKIPSYDIMSVAEAVAPSAKIEHVGIRPGEKLHEEMITATDSFSTLELDDKFVILPATPLWDAEEFAKEFSAKPCAEGFSYNSGANSDWLSVEDLRLLIKQHIDTDFQPV